MVEGVIEKGLAGKWRLQAVLLLQQPRERPKKHNWIETQSPLITEL